MALTASTAGLMAISGPVPVQAGPSFVDPAALERGPIPAVAYLVGDTIRDGSRRIPATTLGDHVDLWTTSRGYLLKDYRLVKGRDVHRLVYVSRTGQKKLIARSRNAAVSLSGRRMAWAVGPGEADPRTVVRVANPNTGRVLASRRFSSAAVTAVTDSRVLLSRLWSPTPGTTWWNYQRNTLSKVSSESAVSADLRNDKIVFDTGAEPPFCNRVAPLSHPARTLWRSCRIYPHQWSPNGARAVATHTYFDESGTDRWLTIDGRTGQRLARVSGRLDWDAVWEDNRHFLTLAQGDSGKAAIIRCTAAGRCERASRLWDIPVNGYPPFYTPPPVVLPNN